MAVGVLDIFFDDNIANDAFRSELSELFGGGSPH